jgi:hypothetical protein
MFETILKLYIMYMATDCRSPLPHLFGPPGCGKSTSVEDLARLIQEPDDERGDLGNIHVINVARLSPLEVEGVQMPHGVGEDMILRMLPATFWTQLRHGDILLLDEFLRGFPEVYNALLDILTSRRVGSIKLPRVFIIAASNSTIAYDKALEDRLLHLPVPDIRKKKSLRDQIEDRIIAALGLWPEMKGSSEMSALIDNEIVPMYEILDHVAGKSSSSAANLKGRSIRNLIGQAQLREVQSTFLAEVLDWNNRRAIQAQKWQFVFLMDGKNADARYVAEAQRLLNKHADKLTAVQLQNTQLNLQLVALEEERANKEGTTA